MQILRAVGTLFLLAAASMPTVEAASVLPPPGGPLPIGRTTFFWTDATRPETATEDPNDKRHARVDLWYPAEADAKNAPAPYFPDLDKVKQRLGIERILLGAIRTHAQADAAVSAKSPRYPVLVLSPGGNNNATYYTALIEDLVSHGYIVAAVDHPYQSRAVLLPSGAIALPAAEQRVEDPQQIARQYRDRVEIRARDMIFALDQLAKLNTDQAQPKFRGRLDLQHVGALGHSIGGVAAPEAARLDSRFKAALNLDGHAQSLPFFPDADGKVLPQPFMELTDGPPRPPSDEDLAKWNVTRSEFDSNVRKSEERLAALMRSIAGGSCRVILRGAKHDHFSDTFLWIPGDLETRHHTVKIVRDYTRAFFDRHLRGQTDTLLDAPKSPYEEVTVERFTLAAGATGGATKTAHQDTDAPSRAFASQQPVVPDAWRDLHQRWSAAVDEFKTPGLAVAVVRGDEVVLLLGLGTRDADKKLPVTVDSPFYIASSTKSFTAMAVAILADEGKIDLDAPVKRYLPRFTLANEAVAEKMTVRDLLAHRLGIDSGPISTNEAYTGLITEDRYYRLLKRVTPKSEFRYSNLNFTLAGRVIEAASGQSWKQFIAQRILRPAGMRHSYCLASELYADPLAAIPMVEVDGQQRPATTRKTDETMHAAGGMGCSAADLARWIRLNLNGGAIDGKRMLSERLTNEMQSSQIAVEQGRPEGGEFNRNAYGLGWFLGEYRGQKLVHHFGGYAGTRCHISFLPEKKLGVAVVINTDGPAFELAELIAADAYDRLLGLESPDRMARLREQTARVREAIARRPRAEGEPPTASGLSLAPSTYVGQYEHDDWGTVQIGFDEGRLSATLGAHRPSLISTGTDRFTTNLIPGSRYAAQFELDTTGKQVVALVLTSPLQKFRFVRLEPR